jgi:hypothetical protein
MHHFCRDFNPGNSFPRHTHHRNRLSGAPLSASLSRRYEPGESYDKTSLVSFWPISETSTDFWSVAEYQGGTFEVDWWMLDGTKFTEEGRDLNLYVQDRVNPIKDELTDEARASAKTHRVQNHTVESFGFSLKRRDGDAIHDHLNYPEINLEDWDDLTENFNRSTNRHCWANFRDELGRLTGCPEPGMPINDECNVGHNRGHIRSVTLLPHEEDHDGGATFRINAGLNDAWVSDDAPFQSFFFTVYEKLGIFFLSWFTFDSVQPAAEPTAVFGANDQRWVTGAVAYSGDTVTIPVELTSGGIFNDSDPAAMQQAAYGTITIVFHGCNEATLTYDFPSWGLSGEMTLTRVIDENAAICEALNEQAPG